MDDSEDTELKNELDTISDTIDEIIKKVEAFESHIRKKAPEEDN